MSVYFAPLFSFHCVHDYYTEKLCPDLQFEPTAQCAEMLSGYRLVYKPTINGGVVVSECKNTGTEAEPIWTPLNSPEKGMILNFKVIMKNPLFLNITDINQSQICSRSAFVFANKENFTAEEPDEAPDKKRFVEMQTGVPANPVPTVGPIFIYPLPMPQKPVAVRLYDESGKKMQDIILKPGMNTVGFDLSGAREGFYEVRCLNGSGVVVKTDQLFVSDAFLSPQLLGYARVTFLKDVMDHIDTPHVYTLSFKNRKIKWKYDITLNRVKNGDNIDTSKLKLVNPPVSFKLNEISSPQDETKRVEFLSDTAISLREKPYAGIGLQLLTDTTDTGNDQPEKPEPMDLLKNMPNPAIDRLVTDERGDLLSVMYLKINIKKEG